jgi:hypothetical protein
LFGFEPLSGPLCRSVKIRLISVISGKVLIYLINRLVRFAPVFRSPLQISENPFDQRHQR